MRQAYHHTLIGVLCACAADINHSEYQEILDNLNHWVCYFALERLSCGVNDGESI